MENVKFSVITVCFNSEKTIKRTIESVMNQTYAPFEYFVIDGKSTDNTVSIAKSYSALFKGKGIEYRVISEKDNGMYDALNKGTRLASGDLIGQINSDDWYETNALEEMAHLYIEQQFDMAYSDLRMWKLNGQSWIKEARVDEFVNSRHWNHPTQFTKRELMLTKPYACQCMSDDLDFMLWVRKNGYKVVVLNETLANFTMEGMSHSKRVGEVFDRVKTKTKIYINNGYSWVHGIDVSIVELGKWVLGK